MEPDETPEEEGVPEDTDNEPREVDGEQDVTQMPLFEPED